ncbi:dephospho-CoA kinase [Flexivirga endophytica]|uniref:Dephospho-CoA kinase n=1 Tax=Flexivirga endophytica TaxID=1849103 RepID=A0A916T7V1_9MICO|nr:dephospho-CoA kinase [Flexivirga endophytica]GGB33736.1 dephospho-CoA kinase [Flexivirga endophytica]GHB41721.1 dephospho-CoA kinase [Flexivirga endophytica]
MLYVGLSGGIGSGKSTVSARFAELGAVVIDADQLAREVVDRGSDGLAEIATRFGQEVLLPDGSLNRPALGAIVFADERARRDLEAITHPRVRDLTERRRESAPRDAIVVHDVPLLVEAGLAPDHHLSLIVDTTAERRAGRLIRDRGMTQQEASNRIAAQATDEQRYAVADALLDNNGTREEVLQQVETLWRERLSPYNDNLLADRGVRRPLPTRLAEPNPAWPLVAERATARLSRHLDTAGLGERVAGIEHIGSTSVPGLVAKDVIDLQVRVDDLELAPTTGFRDALRAAGFVEGRRNRDTVHAWAPDPLQWEKYYFNGADPEVVHHLHVRQTDGPGADTALLFRDWLRANPVERDAYAAEKRRLAGLHPGGTEATRGDYPQAKEPWIAAALLRARSWRETTGGQVTK